MINKFLYIKYTSKILKMKILTCLRVDLVGMFTSVIMVLGHIF